VAAGTQPKARNPPRDYANHKDEQNESMHYFLLRHRLATLISHLKVQLAARPFTHHHEQHPAALTWPTPDQGTQSHFCGVSESTRYRAYTSSVPCMPAACQQHEKRQHLIWLLVQN